MCYKLNMYNHLMYLAYWLINSSVLLIASSVIPDNVTLGSWRFNGIESALYAGFWITFLIWIFCDFAMARKFNLSRKIVSFGFFFIVNSFSIWAVSMFSGITGFELIHYEWVLVIGFVVTILQKVIWVFFVPRG